MMTKTMVRKVLVMLPDDLADATERVAERHMTSSSAVIRQAVMVYLAQLGERREARGTRLKNQAAEVKEKNVWPILMKRS
jgi:metal-responsive CopG/Arc/MetJ family transcriptional regulator